MKRKTKKQKGTAKLKKDLWKVFSAYIRKRDKNICFTCDKYVDGSGYHAGHFISASICSLPLRFSETNVNGQCFRCNLHLSGNWPAYLEKMLDKYGQDVVDDLLSQRHKAIKWTPNDYEVMIEVYKEKLKILQLWE